MKKRTHIDFSKHVLNIIDTEHVKIHHLKIPESSYHNVKFINAGGVLAVTGDFGNWIFCREFHPGPKEFVSDGYWVEKATILSQQNLMDFDIEATLEQIDVCIKQEDDEEILEFLKQSKIEADSGSEQEYLQWARENAPSYEYIVYEKSYTFWLLAVFDAFDEICNRLKDIEESQK